MKDLRKFPRKEILIPIIYSYNENGRLKNKDGVQFLRNISKGGFYFTNEAPLSRGTHLVLKINIVEETIFCQGIVVRCEKRASRDGWHIGIKFSSITDMEREKLYKFSDRIFESPEK